MAKVKIELNRAGVRELLKSPEMGAVCQELASQVAARAGDGYEVSVYTGFNRVNASVKAVSDEAWRDVLKNNGLVKALWGGGSG